MKSTIGVEEKVTKLRHNDGTEAIVRQGAMGPTFVKINNDERAYLVLESTIIEKLKELGFGIQTIVFQNPK